MKTKSMFLTGCIRQLGLVALLTTSLASQAQTTLYQGHADVGLAYDPGANEWELHVHDGENDIEYFPATDALLFVKLGALGTIPGGPQWSFLGSPGASVWTLPKVEDSNLLFLGLGTEEIDDGVFVGNQLSFALKSISGPGHFALYDTDSFGDPIVLLNSVDGITGADVFTLPTGSHGHFNWAFTAPGDYTIWFEAFGNSVDNGFTSSGNVAYSFRVEAVPEPGAAALGALGALALLLFRSRRKS